MQDRQVRADRKNAQTQCLQRRVTEAFCKGRKQQPVGPLQKGPNLTIAQIIVLENRDAAQRVPIEPIKEVLAGPPAISNNMQMRPVVLWQGLPDIQQQLVVLARLNGTKGHEMGNFSFYFRGKGVFFYKVWHPQMRNNARNVFWQVCGKFVPRIR